MLTNYLKIAIRSIQKNKGYSFIMIFGLSISMAYCILTFLYVQNEWSYDGFHKNSEQIYRVYQELSIKEHNLEIKTANVSLPIAPMAHGNYSEVENFTRLTSTRSMQWEDRNIQMKIAGQTVDNEYLLVDPSFFEIFSFNLQQGDKTKALDDPHALVLSHQAALKYYGTPYCLGEKISIRSMARGTWKDFIITGVMEEIPQNSSIKADFIMPYSNYAFCYQGNDREPGWNCKNCNIYFKIKPGVNIADLEAKLTHDIGIIIKNELGFMGNYAAKLQPISDMHHNTSVQNPLMHAAEPPQSKMYSLVLAGLCLIILFISCINFVQLSLGKATNRTKEIGIRKVVGAKHDHILHQFLGESILLAFISIIFGILLATLCLPLFNGITGKHLVYNVFGASNLAVIIGLILLTGLLSGSYPAFLLSKLHPIKTLRDNMKIGGKNTTSHTLVIMQFSFSILLIASTIIMVRQIDFIKSSKTMGFNKDNLLVINSEQIPEINRDGSPNTARKLFEEQIKQHSNVIDVTSTRYEESFWRNTTNIQHTNIGQFPSRILYVDYNFIKTFGIELASGRNFSSEIDTKNTGSIIITESCAKKLGWQEPIGQRIKIPDEYIALYKTDQMGTIVGGVKDFYLLSFEEELVPTVLIINPSIGWEARLCIAHIGSDDIPGTIDYINKVWDKLVPDHSFQYTFWDEKLEIYYHEETQWSKLILYSALFAIIIACLGVLGIISIIAANKTKEIGIRKICGASVASIWIFLSQNFTVSIAVATLIGGSASYMIMTKWLQNFSTRIHSIWWTILVAGGMAMLLTFLMITTRTHKAAAANPVDALRYE